MEQVWHPSMFPVNARTMRTKLRKVLYVHANGTVDGKQHRLLCVEGIRAALPDCFYIMGGILD